MVARQQDERRTILIAYELMGYSMTETALRLKSELAHLPEQDRAALASYLIDTLDATQDDDADAAWADELSRREKRIRSGQAQGELAEKVFAELREKHS